MDFTDPQLTARLQAFEKASESLNGEYGSIAENWAAFTAAGEALAEMSPQAALIHRWYYQDDEGAVFPDGVEEHDGAWYELWYRYLHFREAVLAARPSWVGQAHALDDLANSFSDVRSWFPTWDWERGIWKS